LERLGSSTFYLRRRHKNKKKKKSGTERQTDTRTDVTERVIHATFAGHTGN